MKWMAIGAMVWLIAGCAGGLKQVWGPDAVRDLSATGARVQTQGSAPTDATPAWKDMNLMRRAACWACLKPQTEAEAAYMKNLRDMLNVVLGESK